MGQRIGEIAGTSYMDYIVPGIILMSVISHSYANVVSSFYSTKFQRHIEELLVSPVPNWVILAGYVSGGVCRGLLVGTVVIGISLLFTTIPVIHLGLDLGWWFLLFSWFVIVGGSNAVNLTDGLDGLVIVPVMFVAVGLGAIAYYHHPFVPHTKEMVVLSGSIIGAGLGFLWFNAHPAKVFMGDVGALALGACLALMAIVVRSEIVFAIMGGLFVVEALSVMLQVGSFKLRKKRIFKMAPIHHHFELKGIPETVVTVRFWIVALLFTILGWVLGVI